MSFLKSVKILADIDENIADIDDSYGLKKKVDAEIQKYANNAVKDFHLLFPVYDSVRIVFVKNIKELGRYRSGTESKPIIMLSDKNLLAASKKHDVSLQTAVETTVWHELAHAVVDLAEASDLGHLFPDHVDEEDFVESVAYAMWNNDPIPDEFSAIVEALMKP